MNTEVWKKIPGYGNLYSASDLGRIRRDDVGRIVNGAVTTKGYRQHHLSVNSKKSTVIAHKLVLLAFVGPAGSDEEGCHINGNPLDNRLCNLRWGTHYSNLQDRKRHGNYATGEKHHYSKLRESEAIAILNDPRRNVVLAKVYGVHPDTISLLRRGKTWTQLHHHPDFMDAAKKAVDRR